MSSVFGSNSGAADRLADVYIASEGHSAEISTRGIKIGPVLNFLLKATRYFIHLRKMID